MFPQNYDKILIPILTSNLKNRKASQALPTGYKDMEYNLLMPG